MSFIKRLFTFSVRFGFHGLPLLAFKTDPLGLRGGGGEKVFGSLDLALKGIPIEDLCNKLSGFTDFENTVDRGSAVIFDVDSGLCLSYVQILGPKRNLDHRKFGS